MEIWDLAIKLKILPGFHASLDALFGRKIIILLVLVGKNNIHNCESGVTERKQVTIRIRVFSRKRGWNLYLILSISRFRSSSSRRRTLVIASRSASVRLFNSTSIFSDIAASMRDTSCTFDETVSRRNVHNDKWYNIRETNVVGNKEDYAGENSFTWQIQIQVPSENVHLNNFDHENSCDNANSFFVFILPSRVNESRGPLSLENTLAERSFPTDCWFWIAGVNPRTVAAQTFTETSCLSASFLRNAEIWNQKDPKSANGPVETAANLQKGAKQGAYRPTPYRGSVWAKTYCCLFSFDYQVMPINSTWTIRNFLPHCSQMAFTAFVFHA